MFVPVCDVDGKTPLMLTKPSRARRWVEAGKATPFWKRGVWCVRRQLHRLQFEKGGIHKPYGGTRSNGFKRGRLVKHLKHGLAYVGGYLKDRISLHAAATGQRLTQQAKPADCVFLTFNSWRIRASSPLSPVGVSARDFL
jgi:hypothetical protein